MKGSKQRRSSKSCRHDVVATQCFCINLSSCSGTLNVPLFLCPIDSFLCISVEQRRAESVAASASETMAKSANESTWEKYLRQIINVPFLWVYYLIQSLLDRFLSPTPPPPNANLGRPRIAIIGAGLTGVSSASHCVGHGSDVTIFEAGDRDSLGGIWARVSYICSRKKNLLL